MKKLLSLALTLALVLGLCCPAGAMGGEPNILEEMAIAGIQKARDEYAAAHPEEMATLDVEKLLAGWGYTDMTAGEWFLRDEAADGEDLEEVAKRVYIDHRREVEGYCILAEEYRAKYPEAWEEFDADAYLASRPDEFWTKEEYIARANILTEEEFADSLFYFYILETYNPDGVELVTDPDPNYNYDYNWWFEDDSTEPTLTLYVNGVATDVELAAEKGVSYADADALRQVLGEEFVPADRTGLLPVRATAEAAGWDVGWYSGWWSKRQEVQLWDKASYEEFLTEEFAPLNEFLAKAMEQSKDLLFSEKATAGHETVTVNLIRFSTLDGDKTYKLTLAVDYIVQNGVMDMTCTFDLSQLLQLFDGNDLRAMTKAGGFTPTQLTSLLRAGKAELILDYNEGMAAYNVPLLALFDEGMAGWQSQYVPGLDTVMESYEEMGEAAFTSSLYAQMLTTAGYSGAEYAFEQYDQTVSLMTLFAGKERFTTQNGKTTYSFTTKGVNAALTALLAQTSGVEEKELAGSSFFKACDLTYTLDSSGNVTMEAHIRPDMEGIAAATAAVNEEMDPYYSYGAATMMKWLLPTYDMDMTASARGNQSRATQRLDIHWNNVGKLSVNTTTTSQTTTKAPRQVEDVTDLPEITPWQQLLKDMLDERG